MISIRQSALLVVDDSAAMRTIVTEMLRRLGAIHIDHAASGEEALRKIQMSSYTLIVSDWNMAPMDGVELLRAVKRLQKPRFNRFIFMTSERSYGHRATARVDGADDFIVKPFQIETLKAKVEKVLAYC